jgi:hypothetical protein
VGFYPVCPILYNRVTGFLLIGSKLLT